MTLRQTVTAALLMIGLAAPLPAAAETPVGFALDWKFEGPAAPYFLAIDKGHFAAEGLAVEITAGEGSLDAIPKVATGAYPVGFADMASLVKFLDQNPGAPVTAAMIVYDKPAFAIIGRKSRGVSAPKDLEGKILGAPPPDGAWAQFPAFAAANGIDPAKVTIEPVGFPTREPMLAEGKVDAVTGFSFTSFLNASRLGVPEEDLSVILMADHGLALYGNAIIVNTDFANENPEVVTGFLRAVARGIRDTAADPAAAIEALASRNPALDRDLEQRRLELALRDNILTDAARANGIGGIDPARFASALDQIAQTYDFKAPPDAALYFSDRWLPDSADRALE